MEIESTKSLLDKTLTFILSLRSLYVALMKKNIKATVRLEAAPLYLISFFLYLFFLSFFLLFFLSIFQENLYEVLFNSG